MRALLLEAIGILEVEPSSSEKIPLPLPKWTRLKWVWAGIALAVLSVLSMTLWHFWGNLGQSLVFWKETEKAGQRLIQPGTKTPSPFLSRPLKELSPSIMGEDGSTMLLVPGGDFQVNPVDGNNPKRKIRIRPFYMDENKVSNEKFADFLNEVKETLVVDNGVVKSNGQIWFLMGDGTESYEHIIYRHGRFHLKDPQYAAQPVVRVTWYGALAYAQHFHKQLPTEDQWIFAAYHGRFLGDGALEVKKSGSNVGNSKPSGDINDHMSHMDYSVEEPSKGIRPDKSRTPEAPILKNPVFPRDMGGEVKEWAIRSNPEYSSAPNSKAPLKPVSNESIILGKPSLLGKTKIRSELISNRYPWEGFPKVGFRCVIGEKNNNQN